MIEAKHTPGPWRVVIDDDGNPLSGRPSIMASEELDCGIVHWDGFVQPYWRSARGDKEIHANARLIAAAPDMLMALELSEKSELAHSNCQECEGEGEAEECEVCFPLADDARCARRAAIAKATGKVNGSQD